MTTSNMNFRGIEFIKDFTVKYLTKIFMAAQKGSIVLTNGFQEIKFSESQNMLHAPKVIRKASWDVRSLPAILVGPISGNAIYYSVDKDHLHTARPGEVHDVRYVGGGLDYNLTLTVRAASNVECGNLADIVTIYLSHPDTKDYFQNQGIDLPKAPTISGESQLLEPNVDYPIFSMDISWNLLSYWQDDYPLGDTLIGIIAEFEDWTP